MFFFFLFFVMEAECEVEMGIGIYCMSWALNDWIIPTNGVTDGTDIV